MTTIKSLMDAAIVAMLVVDVILTVLLFEQLRSRDLTVAESATTTVTNESVSVTCSPSGATSAVFRMLREADVATPQRYVLPEDTMQKWDYGRDQPSKP